MGDTLMIADAFRIADSTVVAIAETVYVAVRDTVVTTSPWSSWTLVGIVTVGVNIVIAFMAVQAFRTSRRSAVQTDQSLKVTREALELEQRRYEEQRRERDTPVLRADSELEPKGGGGVNRFLVITNDGPATAHNIVVLVDGCDLFDHESYWVSKREDVATRIDPGRSVRYRTAGQGLSGKIQPVELLWHNKAGEEFTDTPEVRFE